MPNLPLEVIRKYEEEAQIGDDLRNFKESRAYGIVKNHILDPLVQQSFNDFGSVDPGDTLTIIEIQMQKKVVEKILRLIDAGINAGDLAKDSLSKVLPDGG